MVNLLIYPPQLNRINRHKRKPVPDRTAMASINKACQIVGDSGSPLSFAWDLGISMPRIIFFLIFKVISLTVATIFFSNINGIVAGHVAAETLYALAVF